jgi:ABC-type sugar transport system ATPase subunit
MFLGLAHFNNNRILLAKQRVEREVQKRQETLNITAQEIVAKLNELSGDSIQIAKIGRVLVEENPQLAETLQFLISVELEDKHRREADADKI